jgi:hypothetical protein
MNNQISIEVPWGTRKVKVCFDVEDDEVDYHIELINSPSSHYWGAVLIDDQKNLVETKIQSTDMCTMKLKVRDEGFDGDIYIYRADGFFSISTES